MIRSVLHIGQMKTATTAMQQTLAAEAGRLRAAGLLYPETGRFDGRHAQIAWATWAERAPLKGWVANNASPLPLAELLSQLRAELAEAPEAMVVLSAEEFSLRPAKFAAPVLEVLPEPVAVVVYLRPQGEMIESMYRQHVKGLGITSTFAEYVAENLDGTPLAKRLRYADLLEEWETAIGSRGRVLPLLFPEARHVGIVSHFLAAIGCEVPGMPAAEQANPSFEGAVLEFVRRANDYLTPAQRPRFLADAVWLQDQVSPGRVPLLSEDSRRMVDATFAEQNRKVARRWFGGRAELFAGEAP